MQQYISINRAASRLKVQCCTNLIQLLFEKTISYMVDDLIKEKIRIPESLNKEKVVYPLKSYGIFTR